MIIQFASDLHLEFPQNKDFLKSAPIQPMGDILLLAGDIVPFSVMNKHADFFSYLSDHFLATYWIPGNHEYYQFDVATKCGMLNEKIKSNVFLVNNTVAIHENTNFIFSTLWSNIRPAYQWQIERALSDFQLIKYNGYRFSSDQYNSLHDECVSFLNRELQKNNSGKTVVVTHHVPTFLNYPDRFKGDALNDAFAVELFDMIERSSAEFWIYGHHHQNTPDFQIGKTLMLTNQLGYVNYNEHQLFSQEKAVIT